jgi:hypothetical protein
MAQAVSNIYGAIPISMKSDTIFHFFSKAVLLYK